MSGRKGLLDLLARWDRRGAPLSGAVIREGFGRLGLVRDDLADSLEFSDVSYQRILIHSGTSYDVRSSPWRSCQGSPIHDHGGSTCGVYIIEGIATETIFEASPAGGRRLSAPGRLARGRSACPRITTSTRSPTWGLQARTSSRSTSIRPR